MFACIIDILECIIYENECTSPYCLCCPYHEKIQHANNDSELRTVLLEEDTPFVQNFMFS